MTSAAPDIARAQTHPRGPAPGYLLHAGPHAFLIEGAAETCMRESCHFRVHVVGRVGSDRPGWDVTEMAPLAIQP